MVCSKWLILAMVLLSSSVLAQKTTVDPNLSRAGISQNADAKVDSRLDHKVTYLAKQKYVSEVMEDLSELAGVEFIAGRGNSDWRVREDKINIVAKDVKLSSLMASIASVMKFKWNRAGQSPNWTYRLVEDQSIIRKVKKLAGNREKENRQKRKKYLDKLARVGSMSKSELARLKEDDPRMYLNAKLGLHDLLAKTPDLKSAIIDGREYRVISSDLSQEAKRSLIQATYNLNEMTITLWGQIAANQKSKEDFENIQIAIGCTPSKTWNPSNFIQISGKSDGKSFGWGFDLDIGENKRQKLCAKLELDALESGRKWKDVFKERKAGIDAALKDIKEVSCWHLTDELPFDHSDDPMLHTKIEKKIEAKKVTDFIAQLSDTSCFAVVMDYRPNYRIWFDTTSIHELEDALDLVESELYDNWSIHNGNIELWQRDWYNRREARVSQAWLSDKRNKFKKNGTLDIDEMADIASLTDDQINVNIYSDDVLSQCSGRLSRRKEYLRAYAMLSSKQRSMLLSNQGLAFADVSPDIQQSIFSLIDKKGLQIPAWLDLGALGVRAACSREQVGKHFVYTFHAYMQNGITLPGDLIFSTPEYVEPKKK